MGLVNLEEQFTFYASYHHNTINKIIHVACVWPILWSALVLTQYANITILPEQLGSQLNWFHPVNAAFAIAMFYAVCYILMDFKIGSVAAALVISCLLLSRNLFLKAEDQFGVPAWQIAAIVQVGCWISQFLGHGIFEGRAPALLDNLVQAFLMAPLFVLLEVLFFFGYRQEFQKAMWKKVEAEIKKHKSKEAQKKQK